MKPLALIALVLTASLYLGKAFQKAVTSHTAQDIAQVIDGEGR